MDSKGKRAGKGALIQWEKSGTLGVSQNQTLFVLRETAQDLLTEEKDGQGGGIMYTLNNVEVHCVCYRKTGHPREQGGYQGWEETAVSETLNVFDNTEGRTPIVVVYDARGNGGGYCLPHDHGRPPKPNHGLHSDSGGA